MRILRGAAEQNYTMSYRRSSSSDRATDAKWLSAPLNHHIISFSVRCHLLPTAIRALDPSDQATTATL